VNENNQRFKHAHREAQAALATVLEGVVFSMPRDTHRLSMFACADAFVARGETQWVICRLNTSAMGLSLGSRHIADMLPVLPPAMMASAQWLMRYAEGCDESVLPKLRRLLVEIILRHDLDEVLHKSRMKGELLRHGGDIAILCGSPPAAIQSRNHLSRRLAEMDVLPTVHPAIVDVEEQQVAWLGLRVWAGDGELKARVDELMWQEFAGELRVHDGDPSILVGSLFRRIAPAAGGHAQRSIHRRLNRALAESGLPRVEWTTFHHSFMAANAAWCQLRRSAREAITPDNHEK
jgi:hypothetical protein